MNTSNASMLEMRSILVSLSQELFDLCLSTSTDGKASMAHRSLIGESGIAIYNLLQNVALNTTDRVLIEKAYFNSYHIVYDEESLFYYSSFYYGYRVKTMDPAKAGLHFTKANLDILATRLKIRTVLLGVGSFGSSTDNYFVDRLDGLLEAVRDILDKKRKDVFLPALYSLLNLHQTLIELLGICKNTKCWELARKALEKVHSTLEYAVSIADVQRQMDATVQLKFFFIDQQKKYHHLWESECGWEFDELDFGGLDWVPQLRCLRSIADHDSTRFITWCQMLLPTWSRHFEKLAARPKVLLLDVLASYAQINGNEPFQLDIRYRSSDTVSIDELFPKYFNGYLAIPSLEMSVNELNKLYSYDDNELRLRVANSMINVDPVMVQREARKNHGVSEIADMEIPINISKERTHYLCMPFKSAREISSSSVPISYMYQIVRPFTFFDHCIVVFVTAKRCSMPLMNEVKLIRERFNWPVGVIEHRDLAALLKLNNQL